MTDQPRPKMFQIWSKKIMLGLLKPGIHQDRLVIRERLVKYIDKRGLTLTDAATLHAYENSEQLKQQLDLLLTPRPGEKTNLEKILRLLESLVRSNAEIQKGQAALCERLDALELQNIELSSFLTNQRPDCASTR